MKNKILGTFTTRLFSAVVNFFFVILLSQVLGAEGKGEASLILTTVAMIIIFCDFVGGSALVYLTPRSNLLHLLLSSYLWSFFIAAVALLGLSNFDLLETTYIIHIVGITLIQSLTHIHCSIIVGNQKVRQFNFVKLSQTLLNLTTILLLFFVFQEKTVFAYILSLYASSFLALALSIFFLPLSQIKLQFSGWFEVFKKAIRLGSFNQTANLAQFLNYRISYYILGYYWGEKEVGVFSNAASIAESIWLISNSICLVQYSHIANSTDSEYNKRLTTQLTKLTFFVTGIPVLVLFVLPSSFYSFVFGDQFGDMSIIIKTLAPGILLYNFSKIISHYFSGTGRYSYNAICSTFGLIVTIGAGFYLIPVFPVTGPGITASLSYLATSLVFVFLFIVKEKESYLSFLPVKNDFLLLVREVKANWLKAVNYFKIS